MAGYHGEKAMSESVRRLIKGGGREKERDEREGEEGEGASVCG